MARRTNPRTAVRRALGGAPGAISATEAAFAIWLLTHYFREAPEWTMFTNTGDYTLLFPQGKLGSRAWKKWTAALKAAKKARFSK